MQQEEAILATCVGVFRVEFRNALFRQLQQGRVIRQDLLRSVEEIGEQGKVDVRTAVCEEADLQRLDQALHPRGAAQHRRYYNKSARMQWKAFGVIHARQRVRRDQQGRCPVHQRQREVARGQHAWQNEQPQWPAMPPTCAQLP